MPLPLETLITARLTQLGINTHGLAARLGYANTNKGARRLESLMKGRLDGQDELLSRLPVALEVPSSELLAAVRATQDALETARCAAKDLEEIGYRAAFVPHAIILTERRTPSQVAFCAFTRGERWLHIDLDVSKPRSSFARQAFAEFSRRTAGGKREIAFFGAGRGFAVNYTLHRAARFDAHGRVVEILPTAIRIGKSTVSI